MVYYQLITLQYELEKYLPPSGNFVTLMADLCIAFSWDTSIPPYTFLVLADA
jgi:hypothetical protein